MKSFLPALTLAASLYAIPAASFQDTDNDKMPDAWEIAMGLDQNTPQDAGLDHDIDGRSNLNEYLQGSNPWQPDSDLSPVYPVYWDGIVNGWNDYSVTSSWASHLYVSGQLAADIAADMVSQDEVYEGSTALKMEPNRWRFFSFQRNNISVAGFEFLEFYIHGGQTGGQNLKVSTLSSSYKNHQMLGNVNVNDYIVGGAVAANEWRKVRIPLAALVNGESAIARINIGWPNTGTQSLYYLDSIQLIPFETPAQIDVVVDSASQITSIDAGLYGSNGAYWANNMHLYGLPEATLAAGITSTRYPGGSLSDEFHFRDWLQPTVADWITTPDDFMSFLNLSNTEAVITTNFGTGSATEAADFVTYMNVENNTNTKLWEVGNEIYGSWETTWTHDGASYMNGDANHDGANNFCSAMKAVDSSINVSMVGTNQANSYAQFSEKALANASTCFDYYTFHYYAKVPEDYEYYGLISSGIADMPIIVDNIETMISQHGNGLNLKLALTEYNSYSSYPKFLSNEVVNMLFLADVLGQAGFAGVEKANHWFLAGSGGSSPYDLLQGVPNYTRRPSYFVFPLMTPLQGNTHSVSSNVAETEISFYAATDVSAQQLNVVAVSKSGTAQTINVSLPSGNYGSSITVNSVSGNQLNENQVYYNGQLVTTQALSSISPLQTTLQSNGFSYTLAPLSVTRFTLALQ